VNDVLKGLKIEKRDRIINAALDEFAKVGFEKGSTNNIIKAAGISKGSLFHYFNDKQELYDYLIDFTFTNIVTKIKNDLNWDNRDLIERIREIGEIKLVFLENYPSLYNFMAKVYKNIVSVEEITELAEKYESGILSKIYTENIDYGMIKEGLDKTKTFDTIRWGIEKFSEEKFEAFIRADNNMDMKDMMKEINEYIDYLKLIFYK